MADWAASFQEGTPGIGYVAPTPSATANTKGSWTNGLLLNSPAFGFWIVTEWMQSVTSARTVFFDISVDDVVIAENIAFCPGGYNGASTSRAHTTKIYFPLRVPSGQMKWRCSTNLSSHGYCGVTMHPQMSPSPSVFQQCVTIGANTSLTKGVVLTATSTNATFGSWAELTPSSPRLRSIIARVGHNNVWRTGHADQYMNVEIGIGSSGNEEVLWRPFGSCGANSSTGLILPQYADQLLLDIPAGSRLSARCAMQWDTASNRTIDMILYGFS